MDKNTTTALIKLFNSVPSGTYRDGDGSRLCRDLDTLGMPYDVVTVHCERFWSALLQDGSAIQQHGRYWNRGSI